MKGQPRSGFALALLTLGCHGQSLTLAMADGAARPPAGDGAAEAAAPAPRTADAAALDTVAPPGPDAPIDPAARAAVRAGRVAPGGACLRDRDCQSPEQFPGGGGDGACRVCTLRTRLRVGDSCSPGAGDCPLGTACRPDPRDASASICLPLGQNKDTCHDHTDC